MRPRYQSLFGTGLAGVDPQIAGLIGHEAERQARKLILIPSESLCPAPVREALGSVFTNIYAEGYPRPRMTEEREEDLFDYARQLTSYRRYSDWRFYKGTEYVDLVECIAQQRIAQCFATEEIPPEEISVNVQPLSGAAANNSVYEAFVEPGGTVMGMALPHGGHLTHGSPFNRSGRRYNVVSYEVDPETELLDYDQIMELALEYQPEMIIAGYTSYPWAPDWEKFREIADACGAILLADIAHTAGLVVAGAHPSPVGLADVITFTTHKTAFGARGAVILATEPEKAAAVNAAVFPGEQGGPHVNKFAATAVAFKIAQTEAFQQLQHRIVENAQALAEALKEEGLRLAYGGTNTHLLLIDVSAIPTETGYPLMGEMAARILDLCGIVVNKNTIPGDESAADARGIRLGTPWVTQRGLGPEHMQRLATLIKQVLVNIQPFEYQGTTRILPRGKIDLDVMESVRRGVVELVKEAEAETADRGTGYPHYYPDGTYPQPSPLLDEHEHLAATLQENGGWQVPLHFHDVGAELGTAQTGAALFDLADVGLLSIRDWRAEALLQEATTGNVAALDPGQGQHTLLLDADGKVIDDVTLFRLDGNGYLMMTHPVNTERVKTWLRGLSDGYVLFDREDLFRKVQGPAIVEDLRVNASGENGTVQTTALGLEGPLAFEVLQQLAPNVSDLAPDRVWQGELNGIDALICRHNNDGFPQYSLLVPAREAPAMWRQLLERGAQPAGLLTRERLREAAGLPSYDETDRPTGVDLYRTGYQYLFDLTKPYFVGQQRVAEAVELTTDKETFRFERKEGELLRTALFQEHEKLTKRLVPFAGWEMPVWYTSIWKEHRAVREAAGLFDVGHMGVLEVTGDGATDFLDLVTTNYVGWLRNGECEYSYILDPDGHVIDDLLVYRRARDRYMLVVNAVNKEHVEAWLHAVNSGNVVIDRTAPYKTRPAEVEIRDMKWPGEGEEGRMDLALQGPASLAVLQDLIGDRRLYRRVRNLQRFEFAEGRARDMHLIISRTGYTGEALGYEIYVDPREAVKLWRLLLEAGAPYGLKPAGLGARDSTRTEAGLPLYGHELGGEHDISPIGAGYGAFVKWHKPYFIGREALRAREAERDMEVIRFQVLDEKGRPIREGNPVTLARSGRCIGYVTSAAALEGREVGLAYVERRYTDVGTELAVFPVSSGARGGGAKTHDQLELGDRVPLARPARILSRFRATGAERLAPPEE